MLRLNVKAHGPSKEAPRFVAQPVAIRSLRESLREKRRCRNTRRGERRREGGPSGGSAARPDAVCWRDTLVGRLATFLRLVPCLSAEERRLLVGRGDDVARQVVLQRRRGDEQHGDHELGRDGRLKELHRDGHREHHRDRVRVHPRDVVGVFQDGGDGEAVERIAHDDRPRGGREAPEHALTPHDIAILQVRARAIEDHSPHVHLHILPVDRRRRPRLE
mmetsp:Transcript_33534/g.91825  ORF Transcript_33534/g.91825 Transcript_33534/m.91825 type:complete len:219 (-) Transcript_33534:634-1290(-)